MILFWFGNGSLCMIIRYYDTLCYYRQNELAALLGQAPAGNITFLFWSKERTCSLILEATATFTWSTRACMQQHPLHSSRLQLIPSQHNTSNKNII
jgi:hypothetical protein